MVWLQSALLYLHILGAIFWFGSGLFLQHVVVPAIERLPYEGQQSLMTTISERYGRFIPAIGGLTLVLGILRGISTGVLGSLNTAYGLTWVAAIALGLVVIGIGAGMIGPRVQKMNSAASRELVVQAAARVKQAGAIERTGMLGMLVLMVAMRAGY